MTTDYKEQTASGKSWQRAYQVTINNQRGQVPSIVFYEERVVALDGGEQAGHHVGRLTEQFVDPTMVFSMRDPETGAVIGGASYGQLYVLLHSLYFHLAAIRDTPPDVPPAPVESPDVPPALVEPPAEEPAP